MTKNNCFLFDYGRTGPYMERCDPETLSSSL